MWASTSRILQGELLSMLVGEFWEVEKHCFRITPSFSKGIQIHPFPLHFYHCTDNCSLSFSCQTPSLTGDFQREKLKPPDSFHIALQNVFIALYSDTSEEVNVRIVHLAKLLSICWDYSN